MADNVKTPTMGTPYKIINGKKVYAKKVYVEGKAKGLIGGRYKFVYPKNSNGNKYTEGLKK